MKRTLAAFFVATVLGTAGYATAQPMCEAFLTKSEMPKKFQRLSPVLSDQDMGWILTRDHQGQSFEAKQGNLKLLALIAQRIRQHGAEFAILMPPPRALTLQQSDVDRLAQGRVSVDLAQMRASFTALTDQVADLGIPMPDLTQIMHGDADPFYFSRDTHWTPAGAARSAQMLAQTLGWGQDLPLPTPSGIYAEKGNLTSMARKTCGVEFAKEQVTSYDFPGAQGDLFAEETGRRKVALLGSSFSNRYKNDSYRVADALGYFLDADVENFSVSGGGAIGAIEGAISSGKIDLAETDLVIWEVPYTEGLNNESALRQLLGALDLRTGAETIRARRGKLIRFADPQPDVLVVDGVNAKVENLKLELIYQGRKPATIKLRRKAHVPADMRTGVWAVGLHNLPIDKIKGVKIK